MKHRSTPVKICEKATQALRPSEQTLMALRMFARAFDPRNNGDFIVS